MASTAFDDRQQRWPAPGPTVTVGDGVESIGQFTDIQRAVDALGGRGGTVSIEAGFYAVNAGLHFDATRSNVTLRGAGNATRILFSPQPEGARVFLEVESAEHVSVEDLFIVAVDADAIVRLEDSHRCRVRGCVLVNLPAPTGGPAAATAVDVSGDSTRCEIVGNSLLGARAVSSVSPAGVVADLLVRDNLGLSTQVAVSLREARDIEIVHNQFRGFPKELLAGTPDLSRHAIGDFQSRVADACRAKPCPAHHLAAGILIYSGRRVVISENLIAARVAVLGFLLVNARLDKNNLDSVIGILITFGLLVNIESNLVAGRFAGLVHAGIVAHLGCTGNQWLGGHGIVWMSLGELVSSLAPLLASALEALDGAGRAPAGGAAIADAVATAAPLASGVQSFGMAMTAKIHWYRPTTLHRRGEDRAPSLCPTRIRSGRLERPRLEAGAAGRWQARCHHRRAGRPGASPLRLRRMASRDRRHPAGSSGPGSPFLSGA